MRALCTCLPEHGHFNPMVPLARALQAAGHEVAFATAADFCPRVEKAGFAVFPAGMSFSDQLEQALRRFPREASLPAGQQRFLAFVPRMLAAVAAPARCSDLGPIIERWRPDLVVHGEAELAGPVAATAADVPYAALSVGILRPLEMARLAGEILAALGRPLGVEMGPFGGLFRYLYLDVCPATLQSPEIGHVPVAHPLRPDSFDGDEQPPAWLDSLDPLPTVYVSLGTVFNRDLALFAAIVDGLRAQPLNVIVTVGADNDPAALGFVPSNVRVERYIPQSKVLPACDVVVSQGGSSLLPVLSHGLPLLMVPQGANHFQNSQACVAAGVARQLLTEDLTPKAVRREVLTLLEDLTYRENAGRIAQEIERMPPPAKAVGLLERLAEERAPLAATGQE